MHRWLQTVKAGSLDPCARGHAYVSEWLSEKGSLSFLGIHKEGREGHRGYLPILMQVLDSRHLSVVKRSQGWTLAKHPVRMSLQILARTGRWINDSPHVLYDCADTFPLLFSP